MLANFSLTDVIQFFLMILPLLVAVTFHEVAHGYAALKMGDPTARLAGRLTLNPIKHLDLVGSFLLPLVLKLSGSPYIFGYAKPVPTDPRNFKSRVSDLYVAAAGPCMNLLLAFVTWNVFLLLQAGGWDNPGGQVFFTLLAQINLLLMLFNLIPLGPLDGHYILPHFLPKQMAYQYRVFNARFGTVVFLGLIVLSIMGLPIFSYLAEMAFWMLGLITLVG